MRSNCGSEKIYHSKIVLVNKKNQTARKRARRRAAARGGARHYNKTRATAQLIFHNFQ